MAVTCLGANSTYTAATGVTIDPLWPIMLKESEIKLPSLTFLLVDEDQDSINDCMLLCDVGGSFRLIDMPARSHGNAYGINFNDGHAEIYKLIDQASKSWQPSPRPCGGNNDWLKLRDVMTHPL